MQYIEPYNTYIFVAGKNLCGTKIKFAGCREIFWGLGKKRGGGLSILFHFSRLAKRGGGGYPQALPEVVTLRGC